MLALDFVIPHLHHEEVGLVVVVTELQERVFAAESGNNNGSYTRIHLAPKVRNAHAHRFENADATLAEVSGAADILERGWSPIDMFDVLGSVVLA